MDLKLVKLLFIWCVVLALFSSCKRDTDNPKNPVKGGKEHGFITRIELHFKNQLDSNSTRVFKFMDKDGPGGLPPSIWDTIQLPEQSNWNCEVKLFDDTDGGKEITYQVEEDAKNHIFCFEPNEALKNEFEIQRMDSDGKFEIGLQTNWKANNKAKGSIRVTLKHQVNIKNGTCNPGSTDVEVEFPSIIE